MHLGQGMHGWLGQERERGWRWWGLPALAGVLSGLLDISAEALDLSLNTRHVMDVLSLHVVEV